MEDLLKVQYNSKVQNLKIKKNILEVNNKKDDSLEFKSFEFALLIFSFLTVLSDLCTDLILVVQYIYLGYKAWAVGTFLLVFFPSLIIQFFSLRWHISDDSTSILIWVFHFFLLGIVHRFISVIKSGYKAYKSKNASDIQKVYSAQSNLCLLHLIESFLESSPQLVLQVYIIIELNEWQLWTVLSAFMSLLSLSWALAAYSKTQRLTRPNKNSCTYADLLLEFFWRAGLLLARITALVLGAYCLGSYILIVILLHWISMFIWIICQNADFCESYWEEKIYTAVVGVVYCFCFFNLQEEQSRWRMLAFYMIIALQNLSFLTIFLMSFGKNSPLLAVSGFTAIVGGTVVGIACMLVYYKFCHPSGLIKISFTQEESSNQEPFKKYFSTTLRSLKRMRCDVQNNIPPKSVSELDSNKLLNSTTFSSESVIVIEEKGNDGKNLQGEIDEKVENTNSASTEVNGPNNVESDENSFKRRAICSTAHLVKLLKPKTDSETNSDSSLKLAENYESVSEVLSAHDYENLCAVNIAREKWGIRSWKGYSDIETWLHDDSVVNDGGLETLTSTTTSSDRSCYASQTLGERMKQDEFADTVEIGSLGNSSNEIVVSQCFIESLIVTYPLSTLDPIYEEAEDLSTSMESEVKEKESSSSTLVATIDKIWHKTPCSNRYRKDFIPLLVVQL